MEQQQARIKTLLTLYLQNECSEDEKFELLLAIEDVVNVGIIEHLMDEESRILVHKKLSVDKETSARMLKRLKAEIKTYKEDGHQFRVIPFYRREVFRLAASILGLLFLSVLVLVIFTRDRPTPTVATTKPGQKRTIVLSDGSLVTLNDNSKISFIEGQNERRLQLEGEAYFDIAHDSKRPFFVVTSQIEIKVLGTIFNVKSYDSDQHIATTLVRGKVEVRNVGKVAEVLELKPDEQALFNKATATLEKGNAQTAAKTSWREGNLYFEDETAEVIFSELEKWFQVKITLEETDRSCRFSMNIGKETISEVMGFFEKTTEIKVQQRGDHFLLNGKLCE